MSHESKGFASVGVKQDIVLDEGGRHVSGQSIECATCGTVCRIQTNNHSHRLPAEVLVRKFREKGWDQKRGRWLCPLHAKRRRPAVEPEPPPAPAIFDPAVLRQAAAEVDAGKPLQHHSKSTIRAKAAPPIVAIKRPPLTAPPPIAKENPVSDTAIKLADLGAATIDKMSTSDHRRIFRLIDDHWDEDRGRYESDWGDNKIAVQLSVPRVWVAHVREEGFGTDASPAELDEVEAKLSALEGRYVAMVNDAMKVAENAEGTLKEVRDLRAAVQRIKVATGAR